MIKVVCFDFYNTLATYEPSREEVYAHACHELGMTVEPKTFAKSLPAADTFYRDENARSPIDKRPQEEKFAFYAEYGIRIFKGAGVEIDRQTAFQIMAKLQKLSWKFKAYDDSLPTLKTLKNRGLTLGIISNVIQDMEATYQELGLQPYLDFKVTSSEVGCDKPKPEIFLAALNKAKAKPTETLYVGDQYDVDIVGARNVGIKAVLLDRNDWLTDITDCPRIRTLPQIVEYI